MDETNPTWYSVSAGLVVMRLIDAWIAEGPASVSTDRWTVEESAAVAAIPETCLIAGFSRQSSTASMVRAWLMCTSSVRA